MTDSTNAPPSALMGIDVKKYLMLKAVEAPEEIYHIIKDAETWLEELKELARNKLNERVPKGEKTHAIDTPNNTINITRNRGKFKPSEVYNMLTALKIPTANIVALKPQEYGMKAGAFEVLEQYLKDKILTQAQFDVMFDEGNFTVKVKPKSDLAIALNSRNGD